MGSSSCFGPKIVQYINKGNIISINIREDTQEHMRTIKIHDENTLRKAIQMYQEQINKENLNIKKAINENDSMKLELDVPLKDLNFDYSGIIIVYL